MNLRLEFTRTGLGLALTTVAVFYLMGAALTFAGIAVERAGALAIFAAALWALVYFEGVRQGEADAE